MLMCGAPVRHQLLPTDQRALHLNEMKNLFSVFCFESFMFTNVSFGNDSHYFEMRTWIRFRVFLCGSDDMKSVDRYVHTQYAIHVQCSITKDSKTIKEIGTMKIIVYCAHCTLI